MTTEKQNASKPAKMLYRPVGLATSVAAGMIASSIVSKVWQKTLGDEGDDPPQALESEYPFKEILAAALIQGAVFAVVKAATDRASARAFERVTGEWPGS